MKKHPEHADMVIWWHRRMTHLADYYVGLLAAAEPARAEQMRAGFMSMVDATTSSMTVFIRELPRDAPVAVEFAIAMGAAMAGARHAFRHEKPCPDRGECVAAEIDRWDDYIERTLGSALEDIFDTKETADARTRAH